MNEMNKIGYYAVIPATVLFNENIKANEKLLYAIITVLANKEGYCFASNTYLANLLNVQPHTISKWVSHLKELEFICLDIIKSDRGEIIQRRIYPNDIPYTINKTYPYSINGTEGMSQKGQYNNINNNIINKDKIDRLFNYIMDRNNEIPKEFSKLEYNDIIVALKKYDMYYPKEVIEYISEDNLQQIKDITYIITLIVKNKLFYLTNKVSRNQLVQIYNDCKNRQNENMDTENRVESFINYCYKSIENKLLKD